MWTRALFGGLTMVPLAVLLAAHRAPNIGASEGPPVNRNANDADSAMWTSMQNVDLRIAARADAPGAVRVRSLRGRVVPTQAGQLPFLDQPESFAIEVSSGTVALDGVGLTTLLNERVFNYRGSPIRSLRVTIENGQLVQRGVIRKGVDLRFTMWSNVTLMGDGRIRAHPTKLTLLGVNGMSLLHALGLKMEKVLDVRGTGGIVAMDGDDMLLDPLRMMPPPQVRGRLASVRIEGDEIVQSFETSREDGQAASVARVDATHRNYIYYRGGALRFGKLTMQPTDLLIADIDTSDRFDLDLARYTDQLRAGYTKTVENNALHTFMPDRSDLKARVAEITNR